MLQDLPGALTPRDSQHPPLGPVHSRSKPETFPLSLATAALSVPLQRSVGSNWEAVMQTLGPVSDQRDPFSPPENSHQTSQGQSLAEFKHSTGDGGAAETWGARWREVVHFLHLLS